MIQSILALAFVFCDILSPRIVNAGSPQMPRGKSFYELNPTYKDPVDDQQSWIIATPESVGLSSRHLEVAARLFGKHSHSFSMLVVRHDALVFERYFHRSKRNHSNNVHSSSKSILSAAIGIAIGKGLIQGVDQPVRDFLPGAPPQLRIRHLLTMSSGIEWTEDETEYEIEKTPNWVEAMLRLPFPTPPGRKFLYSTALTHLLSAILTRASGTSTRQFVSENLFRKIGIAEEHWGSDPQGISSGGYNLYLTPREMAKFGRLYLHSGQWKGVQVVPRPWVEDSLRFQINARPGFDYGYNWWQRNFNGHEVKFAWGYGGQFIYLVPALDMVVVFTNNTRTLNNKEFDGDTLMETFILPAAAPQARAALE